MPPGPHLGHDGGVTAPLGGKSYSSKKRRAARLASLLPESGMRVGLGTGTTVAFLLPALAERELEITCVATSPETERAARALGLDVRGFDTFDRLDIAIDGADQVTPEHWLVKGGGGAHVREKIVARAADRYVVIVGEDKLVPEIKAPVPLELLAYGLQATLRSLEHASLRDCPPSPDGGVIADWWGPVGDPASISMRLSSEPGVIGHGLFPPEMVSEVIVG